MWDMYKARCRKCEICRSEQLLDDHAFPLFCKSPPRSTDLLFILEAPNRDDTYNPLKGYLTVDPNTDPSGKLFYHLFTKALCLDMLDLFLTNSVLCLPAERGGKRPVLAKQRLNCSAKLRELIDESDPLVVCAVGVPALGATELIEPHGLTRMATAVATAREWYGRVLFPVYHTSVQARNPRNGRPEEQQFRDWEELRRVLDEERRSHGTHAEPA